MSKPANKALNNKRPSHDQQDRLREKRIDIKVKDAILALIEANPDFLEGLIRSNPNLISQYLPKIRDTDAGLIESHLSLMKSYEALPSVDDLTGVIGALKAALMKAQIDLDIQTTYNETVLKYMRSRTGALPQSEASAIAHALYKGIKAYITAAKEIVFDASQQNLDIAGMLETLTDYVPDFRPDPSDERHKRPSMAPLDLPADAEPGPRGP